MSLFRMFKTLFQSAPRATPLECAHRVRAGEAYLVDVREPGEWADGVARSARLLSLSDLRNDRTQWQPFLQEAGSREILLYCASGARSGLAAKILTSEGFRATNTGGLGDWATAGWPIVKPRK